MRDRHRKAGAMVATARMGGADVPRWTFAADGVTNPRIVIARGRIQRRPESRRGAPPSKTPVGLVRGLAHVAGVGPMAVRGQKGRSPSGGSSTSAVAASRTARL